MGCKFKQSDKVYNPETTEIKVVHIPLREMFVAKDGSVNVADDYVLIKEITEGDSDGAND